MGIVFYDASGKYHDTSGTATKDSAYGYKTLKCYNSNSVIRDAYLIKTGSRWGAWDWGQMGEVSDGTQFYPFWKNALHYKDSSGLYVYPTLQAEAGAKQTSIMNTSEWEALSDLIGNTEGQDMKGFAVSRETLAKWILTVYGGSLDTFLIYTSECDVDEGIAFDTSDSGFHIFEMDIIKQTLKYTYKNDSGTIISTSEIEFSDLPYDDTSDSIIFGCYSYEGDVNMTFEYWEIET